MKRQYLYASLLSALILAGQAAGAADGGIDTAGMDRSVKPGDAFFDFANGAWVKETPIPADRSSYGVAEVLSEQVDAQTAELIKDNARTAKSGEARKIADYYNSFMDEAAIEAKGVKPLAAGLAKIAAIRTRTELAAALGATLQADVDVLNATSVHTDNLFGLWVAADLDQPTRYAPFLLQGGLSMPDRDYYLSDNPSMAELRAGLRAHIVSVLRLAGWPDAESKADGVLALETAIAKTHWSRADTEDVQKGDNHWPAAHFAEAAPGLDWKAFFAAAHLSGARDFIVWQPEAVTGEAALVAATPVEVWKDYLTFHYVDAHSSVLPKAFVDERFAFYGKALNGTPELRARWKRAVDATNDALGMAVGKLYAAKYFPPESKAAAQDLVKNLISAFHRRIDALTWMTPQTKAKAQAKLASLKVGVGYPDHWPSYDGLNVVKGDAFGNFDRAEAFDTARRIGWLGKPVDRGEWVMNPQLVNAVNLPVLNALNFPAAILQPPYFSLSNSAAVNYAATGATIGHEISHSFDSAGSLFDSTGRLANWWTDEDLAHFHAATEALAKQFDAYKPFPDLAVNGKQTLDENIADLAGLNAAFDAYHLSLGGQPAPVEAGFSGDQQFFLAFAQGWRSKARDELLRREIITDGHAPEQYRSLTVRNMDGWYAAFGVEPGQALYLAPDQRVKVW